MTMLRHSVPLLALLCAAPAFAQQQGEFELPETSTPAPATGTQVQGPVDDSGIVPVGPRVIAPIGTPTASPTAAPTAGPTGTPTRTPAPTTTIQPTPSPQPTATRAAPRATAPEPVPRLQSPIRLPQPEETPLQGPSITDPIPAGENTAQSESGTGDVLSTLPNLPTEAGPIEAQSGVAGASDPAAPTTPFWWWIVAALAAAVALVAAAIVIRKKQAATPIIATAKGSPGLMPAAAPKPASSDRDAAEDKPLPSPDFMQTKPVAATTPSPAASRPIAPLGLETQVTRLQRSLRAVTVTAQVAVTNRGTQPIEGAVLQGDLVGASKGKPLGEQLASAAMPLEELEELGTIPAGERREITITVRQELPNIEGIRQGSAIVFIPLLRVRFAGEGAQPLASTVLVGHPPERSGGKPTPFLADAPPQNYNDVVGRALG